MKCLICKEDFSNQKQAGKKLSYHIKKKHQLSIDDYITKTQYFNIPPECLICNALPIRVGFKFKKYCKKHSKQGMIDGGSKGGIAQSWNKGLTKKEDSRLASMSENFTGEGNPFWGKRHTKESIQKISENRRISEVDYYRRIAKRSDIIVDTLYDKFTARNDKNIEVVCNECRQSFTTSIVYIEREYQCPNCHKRTSSFSGKKYTQNTENVLKERQLLSLDEFSRRINARCNDFTLLTKYDEYFSRQKQYLEFLCNTCKSVSKKTLQAYERGSRCYKCYPQWSSKDEIDIGDFIESLGKNVVRNNRNIIPPKEIDIVADSSLCIEYEGLFWHNEMNKKSRNYHKNKTVECQKQQYKFLRIYEDQWRDKKDLIKSMIKYRLNLSERRIYARKCTINQITSSESKDFFEKNHLYGYSPSKISWGIFYENKLVSALTMRTPRQKKYKKQEAIEICRFATLSGVSVVGGFGRLFKKAIVWAKEEKYQKIISYADLDTGDGSVYKLSGFTLAGETGPCYWYTDGTNRYDRFKFRAKNGKTEREVAQECNVSRIYGAGSNIYSYEIIKES